MTFTRKKIIVALIVVVCIALSVGVFLGTRQQVVTTKPGDTNTSTLQESAASSQKSAISKTEQGEKTQAPADQKTQTSANSSNQGGAQGATSHSQPSSPPNTTPVNPSTPAQICGQAGYNGNGNSLSLFQTVYPGQWRSDYSFASLWSVPGQTFENFRLETSLFAMSDNLIIRNFYLAPGADYYPVRTDNRESGTGTQIYNGTVRATGATDDNLYKGILVDVPHVTISDMDISGTHDGLSLASTYTTVSNVCIHDLASTPTAHNDGIEIYGGGHVIIKDSEINNNHGQTSAINITNDYGAIDDVLIENVTLSGGGYTIYVRGDGASGQPITNIRFRNVKIASPGYYGVVSYQGAPGAIVEWDVKDAQGNVIQHP